MAGISGRFLLPPRAISKNAQFKPEDIALIRAYWKAVEEAAFEIIDEEEVLLLL